MKCAASYETLFRTLNKLRVVYFPRSGTELGITRDGAYLSEDGDIDMYVDMPQTMLYTNIKELLRPSPHLKGSGVAAEVHWQVRGCPEVHMVYNDWISDEMQHRAGPEDLCSCRMNSVDLLCHRDAERRMYVQYGPSWRVQLGVKGLDMPYWVEAHSSHGSTQELVMVLESLISEKTGYIEREAVMDIVSGKGSKIEENISLILAQLNIIADSLGIYEH